MLKRAAALAVLAITSCAIPAHAWWDTVITVWRPVPLVAEYEVEDLPGVDASAVKDDTQANGGRGGKALVLQPGGKPVTLDVTIEKPGQYALFAILRDENAKQSYGFATLTCLEHNTGQSMSWTLPINVLQSYNASAMFYFPAYAGGKYTLSLKLETEYTLDPASNSYDPKKPDRNLEGLKKLVEASPRNALLVDRLELRDVFGNIKQGQQLKTRRMLTTDEEIAAERQKFNEKKSRSITLALPGQNVNLAKPPAWYTDGRSPEERAEQNEAIWKLVPDFNAHVGHDTNKWNSLISPGALLSRVTTVYKVTDNKEVGMDAAVLLVAMAEKYPSLDYFAHGTGQYTNLSSGAGGFGISTPAGKNVYRGWAGKDCINLMENYDTLFEFIKGNQELVQYVSKKIPTIQSSEDLIRFLDRNLLHATVDGSNRCFISGGDRHKALAALILGPGPDADWLLSNGIFRTISMNMTHRGGIGDHAISSYNRDGVHFVGSVGYYSVDLLESADILGQYRQAGGAARFDINDPTLYPNVGYARTTIEQSHMAGGFRILQGDAGDLRQAVMDKMNHTYPSRVLGGAGLSILETGQNEEKLTRKTGVALTFGIGRGHAHQDTLNIEIVAHRARVSPDLGGRHEAQRKGNPNMRSTRLHNVVEIDNKNFMNPYGGSTTAGTGWNTSFVPTNGVQFMEHYARAASHPDVKVYSRQTSLIDIPEYGGQDETSQYIFDVFRVEGGKLHTYNFHGGVSEAVKANIELSEELDEDARAYLKDYFEGSRRQGLAPAMLQIDWPMTEDMQKHYQRQEHNPSKPITTRLSLFGVQGQKVLVANAYSEYYKYNFPFLHVRSDASQDNRVSVYPAIIEPFAGESKISRIRQLPFTQGQRTDVAAPVLLEVTTRAGTTDLLYSSLLADQPAASDKVVAVTGKSAFVSTDEKGLRTAKLVGGTQLQTAAVTITTPQAAYKGQIKDVDYVGRSLTIDGKLPESLLKNQWAQIGGGNGVLQTFRIEAVKNKGSQSVITHEKSARYYQSAIISTDDKTNAVTCEIEPPMFGSDTQFINGTTVSNEKGDKLARVKIEETERWMHIGWPGYRGSHPTKITLDDIPDTNNDGKRTLTILPKPGAKPKETEDASQPLTIEVLRIDPDGQTFYFKLPDDPNYQQGGWPYNFRQMVNEAGVDIYRALYPGSSYRWVLEGMKPSDFTDADGDGLTKLAAYLYGPGDRFELDTYVHLTRQDNGDYLVEANTPFTLALTAGNARSLQVSTDGQSFKSLKSRSKDGKISAELSASDLGEGKIWLRLN